MKIQTDLVFPLLLYIVYNIAMARLQKTFAKTEIFPKGPTSAKVAVVRKIRNMIKLVSPTTEREIASKYGVSLG